MKKLLLMTIFVSALFALKAQNTNLIFFSEQGERFSIVLNGILQNENPETNIKVTDLPAPSYKLKVIFEDKRIPDIDKTLLFNQGSESTFSIRKNNKGEYVVRYMNEIPIEESPAPIQSQTVIVYHPEPIQKSTTTTTTTTTVANPSGAGVGINVNDPYSGANMNINLNMGVGVNQSTTTTTTTTTTSSDMRDDDFEQGGYQGHRDDHERNHPEHNGGGHGDRYVLPGYNGVYGCPFPMSREDFGDAKESIRSKTFEDSKLTIAKQIIGSNCLLSSQVKEIMLLFTYEDTRLEFAKFAYGYTLDIGNYYKVNDAFTYESSIDDLNRYTSSYRR